MVFFRTLYQILKTRAGEIDFWIALALFTSLGFIFLPFTQWLVANTGDESRFFNTFIVVAFAAFLLVKSSAIPIQAPFALHAGAQKALLGAFLFITAGAFVRYSFDFSASGISYNKILVFSILTITAYCFSIAAFILFLFGPGFERLTTTVTSTLWTLLLLSLTMQPLDWPLRSAAAHVSVPPLDWLGKSVDMGILNEAGFAPKLILLVDGHPFHVAAECNGFGLILSSVLLAILLSVFKRKYIPRALFNILMAGGIGFLFNVLRIVIIVLLTPAYKEHYFLMHEIVGAIVFWGCLVLIWVLFGGPTHIGEQAIPETETETKGPTGRH
ncbi:MAG: archaeosortase/exosortase family protein [Opitutales bacterium]